MCTGNSFVDVVWYCCHEVHPRVYGELKVATANKTISQGSSPCVRGTLIHLALIPDDDRFIPVCTGNSRYLLHKYLTIQVHPRVYGELGLVYQI